MKIRIVIADDHGVLAAGLGALIGQEPGMEVVGTARDGRAALAVIRATEPNVVLMDLSMPEMNGFEATRLSVAQRPQTKVLCLSMYADKRFVASALEAGAAGYLLKESAPEELVHAIRTVAEGGTYLSPAIAGPLVADYVARRAQDGGGKGAALTGRQREVLQLLAEGHSAKAIANRLGVSVKTVGTHREHLMRKLGIRSVAGLTKYAVREHLTTSEPDGPE